jgi:hypothetical protein
MTRRLPIMPVVTAIIVMVFGGSIVFGALQVPLLKCYAIEPAE